MVRTLRQLILEEKCPYCGDPQAYVGMNDVECPNKNCKGFSQRQADEVTPSAPASIESIEVTNVERADGMWKVTRADGSTAAYTMIDGGSLKNNNPNGGDPDDELEEAMWETWNDIDYQSEAQVKHGLYKPDIDGEWQIVK